jgi:ABC-2 type transport system permease protein
VTFLQLPLVFLSTAFMQPSLMPGWIDTVSDFNPVDWAIVAGREAVAADTDWGSVAGHCGLLVLFAAVCLGLATRAFGAYQRHV